MLIKYTAIIMPTTDRQREMDGDQCFASAVFQIQEQKISYADLANLAWVKLCFDLTAEVKEEREGCEEFYDCTVAEEVEGLMGLYTKEDMIVFKGEIIK